MNFLNSFSKIVANQELNFLIAKRFVFNDSFLKIDHFKKEVKFTENKLGKNRTILKQKVTDGVRNLRLDFDLKDVNSFIYISKNDEDLNIGVNAIKLLLRHKKVPSEQINGLGAKVMRLVYVIDNTDLGLKLLDDKDFELLFSSSYPKLILMNKLMIEHKYEKVIELFEKYLNQYKDAKLRTNNKFLFPHDQFVLVTIALYNLNNKDAFNKMKRIMDMIKVKKLEFVNKSLTRCFMVSINQNEPEYALKLLSKFENLNLALGFNLSIIALSKMGFLEEAMRIVENIVNSKLDLDETKFEGRIFKMAVKTLEEQLASHKFLESTNKLKAKFELLKNIITSDKRYLNFDIDDLCKKPM